MRGLKPIIITTIILMFFFTACSDNTQNIIHTGNAPALPQSEYGNILQCNTSNNYFTNISYEYNNCLYHVEIDGNNNPQMLKYSASFTTIDLNSGGQHCLNYEDRSYAISLREWDVDSTIAIEANW